MNATNRTTGRIALVIVGLALLLAGVGTALVAVVPQVADRWHAAAAGVLAPLGADADRAASTTSWTWVLVGAVVLGVLALVVLTTIGGGRQSVVVESRGGADTPEGRVRIEAAAVQHAVSSAVGALPQVASLSVDVFRVKRRSAVRIRVRPRRGASPREITQRVEAIVADLDTLLGEPLPVLLHIARGGSGSGRPDRVH